ncbi:MAG: anaerobic sulfite reductase subunit A [Blautia sp.]|nr:anaerobic sulfite reductase subunit A [Blautia sp.]
MGYSFSREGFDAVLKALARTYRIYAPVTFAGQGRFTDVDVVRYDFVTDASQIEFGKKSEYAFKELLTPLSETLFYFTEDEVKEADAQPGEVLVFLRSCDLHALKRLDQMYLGNGFAEDPFYKRIREKLQFVLIGCPASFENCFCTSMGTNRTEDGYLFSVEEQDGKILCEVPSNLKLKQLFMENGAWIEKALPSFVEENDVRVTIPATVPNSIYKAPLWDEYTARCIGCGRCNFVCPTCTCYTMQDIYYTDNGRVGERRRVAASCMVDGYTNVAGGGEYRRTKGERMRFKVLHKIYDFRRRFAYDMCVGCGRCDDACPEYISFSNIINKVDQFVKEEKADE